MMLTRYPAYWFKTPARNSCAPRTARVIARDGSAKVVTRFVRPVESSSRLSESGHSSSDTESEHDTPQTSAASTSSFTGRKRPRHPNQLQNVASLYNFILLFFKEPVFL